MTFLVQHWLGAEGMARRYADYQPQDGFTLLNTISTIGSFILGISTLFFLWNVWKSYRYGRQVTVDDPWGFGNSLEWATSCPPPLRNFERMPRIRSERPAFDLKYGTAVADLGRDLRQGDTRPAQTPADQLRAEDSPGRSDTAVSRAGARDIEVPAPEDIHRDDRAAGRPGGDPLGPDEGDRPTDPRWRTGGE
jgi:cytochrome c oxidase subunit 1